MKVDLEPGTKHHKFIKRTITSGNKTVLIFSISAERYVFLLINGKHDSVFFLKAID